MTRHHIRLLGPLLLLAGCSARTIAELQSDSTWTEATVNGV